MFVGREYQLDLLSSVWAKEASSLVVVSPDESMTNERQLANFRSLADCR